MDPATRQEMHEKTDAKAFANDVVQDAHQATQKEHGLTILTGLKAYKKAILWSILLSSAVIMEGYDTILVRCVSYADISLIIDRIIPRFRFVQQYLWQPGRGRSPLDHGSLAECRFVPSCKHDEIYLADSSDQRCLHWGDHRSSIDGICGRYVWEQKGHGWSDLDDDRFCESCK